MQRKTKRAMVCRKEGDTQNHRRAEKHKRTLFVFSCRACLAVRFKLEKRLRVVYCFPERSTFLLLSQMSGLQKRRLGGGRRLWWTLQLFFYICCNPQGGARVCVYWTESIYISIIAPIAPDPQVSSSSALLLLPGSNLSCER